MQSLRLVYSGRPGKRERQLQFQLFEPQEGDVCPISQGAMNELELDFLPPDSVYAPEHKLLTGLRLCKCQHAFNALHIIYHFMRNATVQCPVCRSGPKDAHISNVCVPKHIRQLMQHKAKVERMRDVQEQVQDDREASLHMSQIQIVRGPVVFALLQDTAQFIIQTSRIAIELRDQTMGVVMPVDLHFFSDGRIFFVCNTNICIPPANRFQLLGCVDDTCFPGSLWCEQTFEDGHNSLTQHGSNSTYWAVCLHGLVTCYIWSLPMDIFIYIAQL